jgi:hypothetical protein
LIGGGVAPPPASEIVTAGFEALLLMVTAPVTPPVLAGTNVTFRIAVCPELRIDPVGTPVALNPGPEILMLETVTAAPPEFVRVNACDAVEPTFTLRKLNVAGFTASIPGEGGATAVVVVELEPEIVPGVVLEVVGIDVVVELLVEMVEAPALRVDVAAETRLCVAMPVPLNGTVNTRPFERVKLSAAL